MSRSLWGQGLSLSLLISPLVDSPVWEAASDSLGFILPHMVPLPLCYPCAIFSHPFGAPLQRIDPQRTKQILVQAGSKWSPSSFNNCSLGKKRDPPDSLAWGNSARPLTRPKRPSLLATKGTVSRGPASLHPTPGHFRLWRSCWWWAGGLTLTGLSGFGRVSQGPASLGGSSLTPHRRGRQGGSLSLSDPFCLRAASAQGKRPDASQGSYSPPPTLTSQISLLGYKVLLLLTTQQQECELYVKSGGCFWIIYVIF